MKIKEAFEEVLPIIQKFAPTMGAAIGGPVGAAAGYVLPILANAFGADPANVRDIANKILGDGSPANKLTDLENVHSNWINQLLNETNNLAAAEINIKLQWNNAPQN